METRLPAADPHSYYIPGQPCPTHVNADITVDFTNHQLAVVETIIFDKPGLVHLDSRGQVIACVRDGEIYIDFTEGAADPVLGSKVTFVVPESCRAEIMFRTSPEASGLQWLTPVQADSDHPVLYSQGEMINGRSILVMVDSPGVRFTYKVSLRVPMELRGLMAAGQFIGCDINDTWAVVTWEMKTPIPLYLFAIAIGDFAYEPFDERSGVWADRRVITQAAKALARVPDIILAEAKLFGSYLWGTYNTLVLPRRGFPYGAMEHPCLTFMNAMLIEDQYAATRVTIHEMVHSWFGNLITNETWGDFWLNEGVTTFGEWLVIRELLGEEAMLLQIALGMEELRKALADFHDKGLPEYTHLKVFLDDTNPDDVFSRIPYIKGALFLWAIMERVGEKAMLAFLREYIKTYNFTTMGTEEFLQFIEEQLGSDVLTSVNVNAWVYGPGLPSTAPVLTSRPLEKIERFAKTGLRPAKGAIDRWDTQHWILYLSKFSRKVPLEKVTGLDTDYGFSTSDKGALQFEFLRLALECENCPVETYLDQIEVFLMKYGRTVNILPLYRALCVRGYYYLAKRIFNGARAGYHPIGQRGVAAVLEEYES